MTPAARSIYFFGFYVFLVGLTLILLPNLFLKTMMMPETSEVWIRVVGVVAICLGYYYYQTAVNNNQAFFYLTIPTRIFVFISFTAFTLLNYVSPMLIGIGSIDLIGAIWTWTALKK